MTHQRDEEGGELVDPWPAWFGRSDRGHHQGIEDVGVHEDPEPAELAKADAREGR